MAEPVAKLSAVPSLVPGSADQQARILALAQAVAGVAAEQVAANVQAAMPTLVATAKSSGVSDADAEAAARLAYGLIFGMSSLVREVEAGPVVVAIEQRAADGVISAEDRATIAQVASERGGGPAFTLLALDEAEHQAAQARDYARAGRALGVAVVGSGTTAREALATATRRETQRMASTWGFASQTSTVERQLMPLLTSADATLRARGNLLLQDMVRISYSYPICKSEQASSCTIQSGARGPIASSSIKADIAMKVVEQLTPAQLRALDPGSAAALMLAIRQVPAFVLRDVSGAEVGRMTDDWSFVATGESAMPRDGLIWQVDTTPVALDARASAAADKLTRNGPSTIVFSLVNGALVQIRYAPKGRH